MRLRVHPETLSNSKIPEAKGFPQRYSEILPKYLKMGLILEGCGSYIRRCYMSQIWLNSMPLSSHHEENLWKDNLAVDKTRKIRVLERISHPRIRNFISLCCRLFGYAYFVEEIENCWFLRELSLNTWQSLHGSLLCMQNWFVIGQLVIFSFSQRFNASFIALVTFVSRLVTSFKILGFNRFSIAIFFHRFRRSSDR